MQVRFWGVRGSVPVSGARFLAGGNTSCVEVTHDGHRLVLDGGTGLRALGDHVGFGPFHGTILFSHVHWDHIQGVPFFTPAFNPSATVTFAGPTRDGVTIGDALATQMRPPTFPVTLAAFRASLRFLDIDRARPFTIGPFRVRPCDLDHPDGVLAYRIEAAGRVLVYATDVELAGRVDPRLASLADGADLLVHDAMYTTDEYEGRVGPPRRGWGHSTVDEAVAMARSAGVERLVLFHHDPSRDDDALAAVEAAARDGFPGASAAREGAVVAL